MKKKIYINPKVPNWMDFRDIQERSDTHLKKWFGRPFIRTQEFGEDNYEEYLERMAYTQEESYKSEYKLETEEEFNKRREEDYKSWCKHWGDDGIRYDVRILDGGALDRTTNKGSYKTLEEALEVAERLLTEKSFIDRFIII